MRRMNELENLLIVVQLCQFPIIQWLGRLIKVLQQPFLEPIESVSSNSIMYRLFLLHKPQCEQQLLSNAHSHSLILHSPNFRTAKSTFSVDSPLLRQCTVWGAADIGSCVFLITVLSCLLSHIRRDTVLTAMLYKHLFQDVDGEICLHAHIDWLVRIVQHTGSKSFNQYPSHRQTRHKMLHLHWDLSWVSPVYHDLCDVIRCDHFLISAQVAVCCNEMHQCRNNHLWLKILACRDQRRRQRQRSLPWQAEAEPR